MNFDHMPELRWELGYPFALALMLVISVTLWLIFRRRGWLCRQADRSGESRRTNFAISK